MFTELHREEKKEEGDRGGQEEKRGNQKEREIQPVISSLSVLHHLEHTKRVTGLCKKRRGSEYIEATWWRKRRVQSRRELSSQ